MAVDPTMTKPSAFKEWPWNSVVQQSEAEQVAINILVILRRTCDTWRDLSLEEYKANRLKDGGFSEREEGLFKTVYPLVCSVEKARKFAPAWANA